MTILILGHNGMLGHMVVKYFLDKKINIKTTQYKFPTEEFFNEVKKFEGDYIINCIGSIPQKTDLFYINYELPIWLSDNSKCKVIHPGTDCEQDDDLYGFSKRFASDYIKKFSLNTKILKTSIIGPELNSKFSLLEWFLNNEQSSCYGYTKAMWNGITTYEWAKQCVDLMLNWDTYKVETILFSNCISKYELLNQIKLEFNKNVSILASDCGKDKCLIGDIHTPSIDIQLSELKTFYYKNYNENTI